MDKSFRFLCILNNPLFLRVDTIMSPMVSSLCLWSHFLSGSWWLLFSCMLISPLCSMKKYIWFFCSQFRGRVFLCILRRPWTHNLPTATSEVLFIIYLIFFIHYHPFLPCSSLPVPSYVFQSPFYFHVKGIGNVLGELIGKIFFPSIKPFWG